MLDADADADAAGVQLDNLVKVTAESAVSVNHGPLELLRA